jgi:hypothetical protein
VPLEHHRLFFLICLALSGRRGVDAVLIGVLCLAFVGTISHQLRLPAFRRRGVGKLVATGLFFLRGGWLVMEV